VISKRKSFGRKKLAQVERTGSAYPHDRQIWDRIEATVGKHNRPLRDILESFPIYARRINLTRFLVHYELYKIIADLPGCIVECGVYRGAGLLTWAKLLEIFHPGDRIRKVIGFDNFAGFVKLEDKDGSERPDRAKVVGGWNAGPYYSELVDHISVFHDDSFIPRAKRIELVEGDLSKTAARYVEVNPGLRISLLHLDVDLYEPTLAALRAFYPHVVHGGVIIFDEYGMTEWPGESRAVEEYFEGKMPRLRKFPLASTPGAYIIKEN